MAYTVSDVAAFVGKRPELTVTQQNAILRRARGAAGSSGDAFSTDAVPDIFRNAALANAFTRSYQTQE